MNIKEINDLLHGQGLYYPEQEEITEIQRSCLEKLYDFNLTRPRETDKRTRMLKDMFAEIGEDCYIEPPFHANWGGKHVHFGNNVYANFNLTLVDDTHIYVGSNTKQYYDWSECYNSFRGASRYSELKEIWCSV